MNTIYTIIIRFLIYFFLAVFLTGFIMPYIIKKAIRWKILDTPNGRKVHKYSKPRVGGLGMFGIYILLLLTLDLSSTNIKALIVGSVLITFFGFLDDLINIRALAKLFFQILVAYITVSSLAGFGIHIDSITILANHTIQLPYFVSIGITMFWIVGMMNAINLIDGLDGLAGGICAIASFTMFIASFVYGNTEAALCFLILLGVILGFLRYNFNPAKLFMGDAGSLFLGYNIAVLSVIGVWNYPKILSFTIPILVLGIPIYDVITSILRRWKQKKPIFHPDGNHIHHRIMALGFTHKQTVIVLYLECLFLSLASMSTLLIHSNVAIVVFIAIAMLIHFSSVLIKKQFK